MTKSRFLFFIASTLLVLPILAGSLLGATVEEPTTRGGDSLYKFLSVFTETLSLVDQTYVEETDQDTLMAAALDGVTDALDPLAVYVPSGAVAGYLEARSVGVAHSGLYLLRDRGMVYVLAVRAGSPGEQAGVQEGDLIAEIDGRSTRVMPLWEVHELLAGAPGTELDLELIRYAESKDVHLTLGAFEERAPALAFHDDVPVLTLAALDGSTPGRVRAMLERDLAEADRLLIDLRGVAGGDAAAAYGVAGMFAGGELGYLRHRDETLETYTGDAPVWSGRIAVLTDRATLGPAEVLASVLRQKAAAELVGERTFGYAGRQSMLELGSGGVVFLADAFYTGPDAEVLDEPLQPDVPVENRPRAFGLVDEEGEQEEAPDTILDKGLELLRAPVAEKAAA
jgi:carboxyl-terminal processing protease